MTVMSTAYRVGRCIFTENAPSPRALSGSLDVIQIGNNVYQVGM